MKDLYLFDTLREWFTNIKIKTFNIILIFFNKNEFA